MTPARKAALQWFYDRGEVDFFDKSAPSTAMRLRLVADGLLQYRIGDRRVAFSLTDKGRRDLHEAGK